MKIIFRIIVSAMFFVSCKTANINNISQCNENIKFKIAFYKSIEQVENYVRGKGRDRLKYNKSLKFLSKYVKVSTDKMLNYANIYSLKDFTTDKKNWIAWYEIAKCSNLQIK